MTVGGLGDEVLLNAEQIVHCLNRLADKLDARVPAVPTTIVVAGGSCLALMGLRDSTTDVDSVSPLTSELLDAAREVAQEMSIKETWLNASALAWKPRRLDVQQCIELLSRHRLRVVGVPPDALFLMKLNRSSEPDQADMRRLWPRCSFATVHEAVAAFYDAYPDEEVDPFLADHLSQILAAWSQRSRR